MATPMRSNSQDASHRARVADPRTTAKADTQASNFEYDDNEWDIGIGNLIIDLDADIEKTNEDVGAGSAMATNASPASSGKTTTKMAIEHSATVDKGLKMKIKRTKPGTKTSEAKHEIVKSNEQNGNADVSELKVATKHPVVQNASANINNNTNSSSSSSSNSGSSSGSSSSSSKRGSSGHRRDKTRDKHVSDKPTPKVVPGTTSVTVSEVNGVVRVSASQPGPQRPLFPSSTGPGPPAAPIIGAPPGPPPSSPATVNVTTACSKPEPAKTIASVLQQITTSEERSTSPPPTKKLKIESKDVTDVCIGTSIGTITEPDCLGPCEPGTSVTLEGIVWHETEGGVLVVNVTWRGKTYVGTLLDCTRHDWAPPRFCDSPTSDLDSRTPKGRGKRGRAAGASPSTDLSNFTETRSSVHSKLRNGGLKGRRGAANGSGPSTAPSSPTPFVPPRPEPNKRKSRTLEEEAASNNPSGKKTKVIPIPNLNSSCGSPPPSPILLECPEPNCSKKYKHINGLKYHQSHAHGSADDDDTKDVTSMSENDESNIEAPSPVTPVKSPDKSQDSPLTPQKKDSELPLVLRGTSLLEVSSQPETPHSTPSSPGTPQSFQDLSTSVGSPTVPMVVDSKPVVKPGVLRFNSSEEFPMGVFPTNKAHVTGTTLSAVRTVNVAIIPEQQQNNIQQNESNVPLQSFTNQLQPQNMPSQVFDQPPTLLIPSQNSQSLNQNSSQLSPSEPESPSHTSTKITQFKVKPTSALMPEDKKERNKLPNYKKKSRKSPAGSPHPPQAEQPVFGMEPSGRDEVQSPAYSDISDDGAPVIETDIVDKTKGPDKKTESGQPISHLPQYGMYPFYGQPPYIMPSVQQSQESKPKEQEKSVEKSIEKEAKKEGSDYQQKVIQPHYYNPYGYVPGYPYNMDPNFGSVPIVQEDKIKEERIKESPSPADHSTKPSAPIPNPIQVPTPGKLKNDMSLKEKQNENHQILKESIEIKTQMSPYMYSRQQQSHHSQREEDIRRFYVYPEQRRKEQLSDHKSTPSKVPPPPAPSLKTKEKIEEKKEKDVKHEGVKPTMETQGPPPPPTSQYAYIHPSYMQSPHYGALPFDPNHPMYRGIMVPGPYSGNPYLHPQLPRYHAPEDLSRPPPPAKTLDMLQHHAQYYSSHKIHELQERAIKSPTPKTSVASSSPSGGNGSAPGQPPNQMVGCVTSQPSGTITTGGKQTPGDNKESRSPPPQRHVHTHHHTHVGLGYPMYPAPYGAAVLASQQAAAVTVINPYPPK